MSGMFRGGIERGVAKTWADRVGKVSCGGEQNGEEGDVVAICMCDKTGEFLPSYLFLACPGV